MLIRIVKIIENLLLHHYFYIFSSISFNFQNLYVNIDTVHENTLTYILRVSEDKESRINFPAK